VTLTHLLRYYDLFWVWMMHACKCVGKREHRETSGGVLSETWKKRTLNNHCWRRRRSTTRTAPVVKWMNPKSWVRDILYSSQSFSSCGCSCSVLVTISLSFHHYCKTCFCFFFIPLNSFLYWKQHKTKTSITGAYSNALIKWCLA